MMTRKVKAAANNEYVGTIYDNVFKTLITRIPEYVIPIINEVFGTNYSLDKEVIQLNEEFYTAGGKIIADSVLLIDDKRYHIEMQSSVDGLMAVRMIEYDFAIALRNALKDNYDYEIELPKSCVLYARHNEKTPCELMIKMRMDKDFIVRKVPIIKLQNYTISDIFSKKLLVFLPFYIVGYEKQLKEKSSSGQGISDKTIKKLARDYKFIFDKLDSIFADDNTAVKNVIIESIEAISEHILSSVDIKESDREEIRKAMGGQVIEMIFDRARREGREEGEERGERRTLFNLYNEGHITSQLAAEKLGLSQEQFLQECQSFDVVS